MLSLSEFSGVRRRLTEKAALGPMGAGGSHVARKVLARPFPAN